MIHMKHFFVSRDKECSETKKLNDDKPKSAILHSGGPNLLLAAGPPAYLVILVVCSFVSRDGQPIDFLRKSFTFLALDTNKSVSDTKK